MSESKESKIEERKENDRDQIVVEFLKFIVGAGRDSLGFCTRSFVAKNSRGFEKAEEYREQGVGYPLAWTELYKNYCSKIDNALVRFCIEHDQNENEVFEKLKEASRKRGSKQFLPEFLRLVSFENFVETMSTHAQSAGPTKNFG